MTTRPARSPRPDVAASAWVQAHDHADGLFYALDRLAEAGGLSSVVASGDWGPKARKRAEVLLLVAREMIDHTLADLRSGEGKAR